MKICWVCGQTTEAHLLCRQCYPGFWAWVRKEEPALLLKANSEEWGSLAVRYAATRAPS